MIKTFKTKETERLFTRLPSRHFPANLYKAAWKKLAILDAAEEVFMTKKFAPIHPGEILLEEFLKPMGISQYKLAKDINVHPRRVNQIVHGKRSISADTALRLSKYFGQSEQFWMNLQARYDLELEKDRLEGRLDHEVKVLNIGRLVHAHL